MKDLFVCVFIAYIAWNDPFLSSIVHEIEEQVLVQIWVEKFSDKLVVELFWSEVSQEVVSEILKFLFILELADFHNFFRVAFQHDEVLEGFGVVFDDILLFGSRVWYCLRFLSFWGFVDVVVVVFGDFLLVLNFFFLFHNWLFNVLFHYAGTLLFEVSLGFVVGGRDLDVIVIVVAAVFILFFFWVQNLKLNATFVYIIRFLVVFSQWNLLLSDGSLRHLDLLLLFTTIHSCTVITVNNQHVSLFFFSDSVVVVFNFFQNHIGFF